jgi:hypothetical protein
MEENLALQEKADGGDPISIEVLRSMRNEAHSEAQREIEAIAHAQFHSNRNDFLFDMQVSVQEDTEPPLGDSVMDVPDVMVEDALPAWQVLLPISGDTAAGTSSNAKSTAD